MKFFRIPASVALIAGLVPVQSVQSVLPSAEGIWQISDDIGNPSGWFKIYIRSGVYEGQIVKVFFTPGQAAASLLCTACRGTQKDAPALGLTFIVGMKKDGLAYDNGRILNPLDGLLYRARMDLSEDGNNLIVQIYLTADKFGAPRVWSRVPDSRETRQFMVMPAKD